MVPRSALPVVVAVVAVVTGVTGGAACVDRPAAVCNDDGDCDDDAVCLVGRCATPGSGGGEGEGEPGEGEGEGEPGGEGEGEPGGEGEGESGGEGEGESSGEGEGESGGEGEGESGGEGEGEGEPPPVCTELPTLSVSVAATETMVGLPVRFTASAVDDRGLPLAVTVTGGPFLIVHADEVVATQGAVDTAQGLGFSATDRCGGRADQIVNIDVLPASDCSILQNGAPGAHATGVYLLSIGNERFDAFCAFPDLDPQLDGYGLAFKVVTGGLPFGDSRWTNDVLLNAADPTSLSLSPSTAKLQPAVNPGFDIAVGFAYTAQPMRFWRRTLLGGGMVNSLVDIIEGVAPAQTLVGRAEWGPLSLDGLQGATNCVPTVIPSAQVRIGMVCGPRVIGVGRSASGGNTVGDGNNGAFAVIFNRSPDFRRFVPEASCKAHRDRGRTVSGRYLLQTADDGQPFEVHCEMRLDGGGWTLVGRSDEGSLGAGGFGWFGATGDLQRFEAPYSLGAAAVGLNFSEVMFARRGTSVEPLLYAAAAVIDPVVFRASPSQVQPVLGVRDLLGGCDSTIVTLGPATSEGFVANGSGGLSPGGLDIDVDRCTAFEPNSNGHVFVR